MGVGGQITYIYSSNPSKVARGINSWLCLATRCETWRFSGRVGSTGLRFSLLLRTGVDEALCWLLDGYMWI